jgi:NTP pyrophosphatase (non-canonical NTP hydrolase)
MQELQKRVGNFCKENNLDTSVENRLLDALSEMGELVKEVLKSSSYGREKVTTNEEMKDEMGDVLFALLAAANSLDVDLEESLEKVLEKYRKRLRESGSVGSSN